MYEACMTAMRERREDEVAAYESAEEDKMDERRHD